MGAVSKSCSPLCEDEEGEKPLSSGPEREIKSH